MPATKETIDSSVFLPGIELKRSQAKKIAIEIWLVTVSILIQVIELRLKPVLWRVFVLSFLNY
jgi:hypothetical protein